MCQWFQETDPNPINTSYGLKSDLIVNYAFIQQYVMQTYSLRNGKSFELIFSQRSEHIMTERQIFDVFQKS